MSSSANEDQEQRKNPGMEDSDSMTIEFLRARLLSERSISKTAWQRADELAKRVAELEEQLKFVSLQRKKAERATSDVLAILENCGISDVSEGFDSCSDDDETPHELPARNGAATIKESPLHMKVKKNEVEAYSSSEFESSQSTGRSLSWKSTKNSQYSLEKKKCLDSFRRRASVASSGSSARRLGKSCRRIRRRESRSPEELQNDGLEQVTCHTDVSNCSDGKLYGSRESIVCENENSLSHPIIHSNSETQKSNGHHTSYEDMKSVMQRQVQLIGQYEAEEKAQREWEEKFRENNTGQQDSCDPGNHSDVTEEPYDIKSPELSYGTGVLNPKSRETTQESIDARLNEEPKTSEAPSASEFSFPMSKDTSKLEFPREHDKASTNLVVVPQKDPNNLGSVLEALQRAKLSLNQTLNSSLHVAEGISSNIITTSKPEIDNTDRYKVPIASPGLFRLPTDQEYGLKITANHPITDERFSFPNSTEIGEKRFISETASSMANHPDIGAQSRFSNFSRDIARHRALSGHFVDPGGVWSGYPPQMYLREPRLGAGSASSGTNQLDAYSGAYLPLDRRSYSYIPDTMLRLPLNQGDSRTFQNSETGLPPIIRYPLYEDVRQNMHI